MSSREPDESIKNRLAALEERVYGEKRTRSVFDWVRDIGGVLGWVVAFLVAAWNISLGDITVKHLIETRRVVITEVELYRNFRPVPGSHQTFDARYGQEISLEVRANDENNKHYDSGDLDCEWTIVPQQSETVGRNENLLTGNNCRVLYAPLIECVQGQECLQTVVVEIKGLRGQERKVTSSGPVSITFKVGQ